MNKHNSVDKMRLKRVNADLENAFAEEWKKENETRCSGTHFLGLLQSLMIPKDRLFKEGGDCTNWLKRCRIKITQREAIIAATVIQWLGTNVGFLFMNRCLRKCGYSIEKIESRAGKDGE